METNIQILTAEYIEDLTLHIFFSDGTSKIVDFRPFLTANPHPQYNCYLEPENFQKFKIESGNIVWGNNWDLIFPIEQLYDGIVVN